MPASPTSNNGPPPAVDPAEAYVATGAPGLLAMYDTVDHETPWTPSKLHRYLDDIACKCAARDITRVAISVPPQHGKSTLISGYMPPWWLMKFPDEEIILTTYSGDYAADWGGFARSVFERNGHLAGMRVRPGVDARARWAVDAWDAKRRAWVEKKGSMRAVGAGGPITGRGASLIVIDDLLKGDEEALSETMKEKKWNWYKATLRSRARNRPRPGVIIIIATRWAEDDLTGRLKEMSKGDGEKWLFVNLPALCEPTDDEPEQLGREPGEALCPELHTREDLLAVRSGSDEYWWSSLYQGRPIPLGGGVFKQSWFRHFTWREDDEESWKEIMYEDGDYKMRFDPRKTARVFATADVAVTEKEHSDFSVISVWALHDRKLYLLEVTRFRAEGPDIVDEMKRLKQKWSIGEIYIEEVAWQLDLIQFARKAGLPVLPISPGGKSKTARAFGITPNMRNGQIIFPQSATWLGPWMRELLHFTANDTHAHDDQVDTMVYAAHIAFHDAGTAGIGGGRKGNDRAARKKRRGGDMLEGAAPSRNGRIL